MKKDDSVYLRHILDAVNTVEGYLHNIDEAKFRNTQLLQDGAIRQIEIIGEAVRHVSKDLRKTYPEVPSAFSRNGTHPDTFGNFFRLWGN